MLDVHQDRHGTGKEAGIPRCLAVCQACQAYHAIKRTIPQQDGSTRLEVQHFCEVDHSGITVTKSGRGFKWKNDPKELTEEGFVRKGSPETCIMKLEQIVLNQSSIS